MTPDIIYEDKNLLVCHKPAGLATETGHMASMDLVSLLKNYRAGRGEEPYIGTVHRLDQPVEGLLVFGKTGEAAAGLSKQVKNHAFEKCYYALGDVADERVPELSGQDKICLIDYIEFDRKKNFSRVVPNKTPQAKKAVLEYRVVGRQGNRVCFDIRLETGRHHQIRLQMAHHGCPLVGDRKYGATGTKEEALALCAYRLAFFHPVSGGRMEFGIRPDNPAFAPFL